MAGSQNPPNIPIIDEDYFARRLACWLAPDMLLQSARRLASDRENALQVTQIVFGSNTLPADMDGGVKDLAVAFLSRFRIPEETIQLLRSISDDVPDQVWHELSEYRFEGKLLLPKAGQTAYGQKGLYLIEEKDIYNDILMRPLQALNSTVADLADTWRGFLQTGSAPAQAYLLHSAADPLGVWLDAVVAAYHNIPYVAQPGQKEIPSGSPVFNYRSVTLQGWEGVDPRIIEICRDSARSQAAQTRQPL